MCCPASRYALEQLGSFAQTVGERALHTPGNPISIGMTISHSNGASLQHPDGLRQGHTPAQDKEHSKCNSSRRSKHEGEDHDIHSMMEQSVSAPSDSSSQQKHSIAEVQDRYYCTPGTGASSSSALGGKAGSAAADASLKELLTQADHVVPEDTAPAHSLSMLGAMLFKRGVSGTRVVAQGKVQSIAGHSFQGYGAHHASYPHTYLTFAAALGTTKQDVDAFLERLRACLEEFRRTP